MITTGVQVSVPLLKEIRLFQSFTDEECVEILKLGNFVRFESHTNVVIEGELSGGLFLIVDGLVGVYKVNKLSGDLYDVAQLRPGSFFGEMSLIDDSPRSATVRALLDTDLFYLAKETFQEFLEKSQDRKMRFLQNCTSELVKRLRELDDNYIISQYQLWKTAIKKEVA